MVIFIALPFSCSLLMQFIAFGSSFLCMVWLLLIVHYSVSVKKLIHRPSSRLSMHVLPPEVICIFLFLVLKAPLAAQL